MSKDVWTPIGTFLMPCGGVDMTTTNTRVRINKLLKEKWEKAFVILWSFIYINYFKVIAWFFKIYFS